MKNVINAILIHEDDNVITVTTLIKKGSIVAFQKGDEIVELNTIDEIPVFHKVAIHDIAKDASVYKYGQLIGKAVFFISRGSHVHDHNIISPD